MSTDRLIVHRKVADEFVARLTAKAKSMRAGKPGEEGAALAAMIDTQSAQKVQRLVADAVAKGASLTTGQFTADGAVVQPSIVDGVTKDMNFYAEESFGPVVGILRFDSDDEAVALANDSEYGLSSAVFSRDVSRAMAVAKRIESGICHINSSTVHDEAQMPFGGVKASGYGRFGGKAGVEAFTELRWITIQTTHRHYPV
jgi:acyl-CoA reductase-like NAD-dependent aldehyde dehydrogenase